MDGRQYLARHCPVQAFALLTFGFKGPSRPNSVELDPDWDEVVPVTLFEVGLDPGASFISWGTDALTMGLGFWACPESVLFINCEGFSIESGEVSSPS